MAPTTLTSVLARLDPSVSVTVRGDTEVEVSGITHDSRAVVGGTIFVALRGVTSDGHGFAVDAVGSGATVVVCEHALGLDATEVIVGDTRGFVGPLSAAVYDHPSRAMTVVGVTGTNGKTTTTHMLAAIFEAAGLPPGIIGTLSGTRTTPEAPELQARLAEFVDDGKRAVAMEVSSHALALQRVDGSHFAVAVFTNLGRDHLDLHGTEQQYFAAKARLFTPELADRGVINLDDVHGHLLADAIRGEIPSVGFSLSDATDLEIGPTSHRYVWRGQPITVPIGGRFNASNSLAAATAASELGIDTATIAAGLALLPAIPGRFEPIVAGQPFSVVIDYAHTPDGLRVALRAAADTVSQSGGSRRGRVIVVFGCGGDRDHEKRPVMGAVAAELADQVLVTSDNPRDEDPQAIIECIVDGVAARYRGRVTVEPDRRAAIAMALAGARPGDVVLIAGKGHETTQTIGTKVLPFDDRAVARALLENAT